jgi:hypothetical protein
LSCSFLPVGASRDRRSHPSRGVARIWTGWKLGLTLLLHLIHFFGGGSSRGIVSFRVFGFDSPDSARLNGRADGDSVAMIQIPISRREIRAKESQVLAGATRNRPPLPPESGIPSFSDSRRSARPIPSFVAEENTKYEHIF